MEKVHINLSADAELIKKAKQAALNISAIAEDAIKKKLGQNQIEGNKPLSCDFCGTWGEKETADDVRESMRKAWEANSKLPTAYADKTKLTWLYPDEQWICNKCLLEKMRKVPIA